MDIKGRALHDFRAPDRFGRRYRELHSLTEGTLFVTIEGVEVPVDLGELLPA